MTSDVCNLCWGSGDEHRHWVNLRAMEEQLRANDQCGAAEYLAKMAGTSLMNSHAAVEEVCAVLDAASRPTRRKPRAPWFNETCHALASTLRCGITERLRRDQESVTEHKRRHPESVKP